MKGIHHVVQDGQEWLVMRLCDDWQTFGACRYELWCQCVHAARGPLREVVFSSSDRSESERVCSILERREVGEGGPIECDGAKRTDVPDLGDWEVPF